MPLKVSGQRRARTGAVPKETDVTRVCQVAWRAERPVDGYLAACEGM